MKMLGIIGLMFLSIVLTYAVSWVIWEYLWVSIPIFFLCYWLYKREFPGYNWGKVGFRRLMKML